jgi:hypothetical protein
MKTSVKDFSNLNDTEDFSIILITPVKQQIFFLIRATTVNKYTEVMCENKRKTKSIYYFSNLSELFSHGIKIHNTPE